MLGVTYKTAWFMAHCIREAMRPIDDGHLGGEGKFVEADEIYVGGKAKNQAYAKTLPSHEAVTSLVERGGKVRSHPSLSAACGAFQTSDGLLRARGARPPRRCTARRPFERSCENGSMAIPHDLQVIYRLGDDWHRRTVDSLEIPWLTGDQRLIAEEIGKQTDGGMAVIAGAFIEDLLQHA
jgi:hypothetical protein